VEEDAEHVQEGHEDHQVGSPPVQVSQEEPVVDDVVELLHVPVGLRDRRVVIEHQQEPGRDENQERHRRDPSQPVGVPEAQGLLPHLDGVHVEEEVLEDDQGPVAVRVRGAVPDDRAVHRRSAQLRLAAAIRPLHTFRTFLAG
jgi:hypothetical protein